MVQLTLRKDRLKLVFESNEEDDIYEARARDLANVIAYDKEHYRDVNISTILRAACLAGIITNTEGENE